ncbi:MAG: FAD:protein FMN transferase [Lentisphaerae bacterium]|nr:FAD:protein FMN transferase [Lentisphaerota bacterium]
MRALRFALLIPVLAMGQITLPPVGPDVHRRDVEMMGTQVGILVIHTNRPAAEAAITAALHEMERVESLMTEWRPPGDIYRVNQSAGDGPVTVDHEVISLLLKARALCALTDGAFDITFGPLARVWNWKQPPSQLPNQSVIERALALVGDQHVIIDEVADSVTLPQRGMSLGLGGIAKGYAVDRAVDVLKHHGMQHFVVNAGGDLAARGRHHDALWRIGIQHPREIGRHIAMLPVSGGAVVTSGDNERFMMINGKRYAHIIDPRSGWPANHCQAVTILARNATQADALATGVFVLGPVDGLALVEKLEGVEGLIVDANGEVILSSGLRKGQPLRSADSVSGPHRR